jgi:hypothetical protein
LSLRKKSEPTSISEVKTFKTYFLFPRLPLVTRIKFLHLSSIHLFLSCCLAIFCLKNLNLIMWFEKLT